MRITTWNVNGMRAALRNGFADVIANLAPDVLLLQEVRALPEQLPDAWREPEGWHVVWHPAQKKGYAGTAVWSRTPITIEHFGVEQSNNPADDTEGRLVYVRTSSPSGTPVRVASVYLPSGSSGDHRQAAKEQWMPRFTAWCRGACRARIPAIIGGDINTARTPSDLYYAKSNEKNSGFLPHERAWIADLLSLGLHDCMREHAGEVDGPYSWWSNRGQARALDRGWRIDYLLANNAAAKHVTRAHTEPHTMPRVSDHAPVTVDLDL